MSNRDRYYLVLYKFDKYSSNSDISNGIHAPVSTSLKMQRFFARPLSSSLRDKYGSVIILVWDPNLFMLTLWQSLRKSCPH